jgi:hypothetical protein
MTTYKLYKNSDGEVKFVTKNYDLSEGNIVIDIPFDEANTDYQEYLAWVAEGNTAEAAD